MAKTEPRVSADAWVQIGYLIIASLVIIVSFTWSEVFSILARRRVFFKDPLYGYLFYAVVLTIGTGFILAWLSTSSFGKQLLKEV